MSRTDRRSVSWLTLAVHKITTGTTCISSMTDTRLPDRWLNDYRLHVSPVHFRSFVSALMWCVANRTDGVIEADHLGLVPHFDESVLPDLVKSGLFAVTAEGWCIPEYTETQTSKAELDALARARASNRERQARFRLRQAEQGLSESNVTPNVTETVTETVTTQARRGKASPTQTEQDLPTEPPDPLTGLLRKSGTSPARASRLPAGWQPPDDVIRAMHSQFPGLDLRAVHEDFCDYWHAKAKDATRVDWVATWRRWIRKAAADAPPRNGRHLSTADQRVAQVLAMKSTAQPSLVEPQRLELL